MIAALKKGMIICCLLGTMPFQSSCITAWTELADGVRTRVVSYRSEDYVIVRLKDRVSPESLAQHHLGDKGLAWFVAEANRAKAFQEGEVIVIPLKDNNRAGLRPNGYQVVPILCYETFTRGSPGGTGVSAQTLDRQMRFLVDNGYRAVGVDELQGFLRYEHGLPEKSVVITIDDDSRASFEIAYPILKRYGFKAAIFVTTERIESSEAALTWNQLKSLKAHGWEVGSRGVHNRDLTRKESGEGEDEYRNRIETELSQSKEIIDRRLAQDTLCLAYPLGKYGLYLSGLAERVGYKLAFTRKPGGNPFFAHPFRLNRSVVSGGGMDAFKDSLVCMVRLSLE